MDEDLEGMSREQLLDEVKKLRQGIRQHRDSTGQELCWHHPALWGTLPEQTDPVPVVPDWRAFTRGCVRYDSRPTCRRGRRRARRSPTEADQADSTAGKAHEPSSIAA